MATNVADIADFNLEILHFINRIKKQFQSSNVVDMNTVDYLLELVNTVNKFLDKTNLVDTQKLTSVSDLDFTGNEIHIHRNFECKVCKIQVKSTRDGLYNHIHLVEHKNNIKKFKKTAENPIRAITKITKIARPLTELPTNSANSSIAGSKTDLSLKEFSPKAPPRKQNIRDRTIFGDTQFLTAKSIPKSQENINKNLKKFLTDVKIITFVDEKCQQAQSLMYSSSHDKIRENIKKLLIDKYPNVKIYNFGSRLTGLGTISSDLDIFIDVDSYYNGSSKNTKEHMKKMIEETHLLLKRTAQWSKFEPIRGARTPILRAWNDVLKVDCDLSFSNGLSHCNTALIRYLLVLQPVCHRVAIFVKFWAIHSDFIGMNSYVITMLVIFYFQTKKLLPSIKQLQKSVEPFYITHWQANYEELTLTQLGLSSDHDFRTHLKGFFEFFGNKFSFGEFIVCPLLGYGIRKKMFDPEGLNIPPEMTLYAKFMEQLDMKTADKVIDLFAYDKPMVVQDPFELNHNVAKSMKANVVAKFIVYCKHTATFLKNNKKFE